MQNQIDYHRIYPQKPKKQLSKTFLFTRTIKIVYENFTGNNFWTMDLWGPRKTALVTNKPLHTTTQCMTTTSVSYLPASHLCIFTLLLPAYHLYYYLWIPACFPTGTEKGMKIIFAALSSYLHKDVSSFICCHFFHHKLLELWSYVSIISIFRLPPRKSYK